MAEQEGVQNGVVTLLPFFQLVHCFLKYPSFEAFLNVAGVYIL